MSKKNRQKKHNKILKESLNKLNASVDKFKAESISLQTDNDSLNKSLLRLSEEKEKEIEKLEQFKIKNSALSIEKEDLKQKLQASQIEITKLKENNEEFEEKIQNLNDKILKIKKQRNDYKQSNENYKNEIKNIQNDLNKTR